MWARALDLLRGRILVRVGRSLGQSLSSRVFDTIGRLALARRAEAVDPGTVRALYVRRPDAEIARDEKIRVHAIDSKAH